MFRGALKALIIADEFLERDLGKFAKIRSEADLFRLLFRDLSTGGIVRQHREITYAGDFIAKRASRPPQKGESKTLKSAFDNEKQYELTVLGEQFVHYAMAEVPPKLDFDPMDSSTG